MAERESNSEDEDGSGYTTSDDSERSFKSDDSAGDPEEYYKSKEFYDPKYDRDVRDDPDRKRLYKDAFWDDALVLPGATPEWSILPPEIQDAIVDAAWDLTCNTARWDAKRKLRATLLGVSRAWARRARRFLHELADVQTPEAVEHYLDTIREEREGQMTLSFCELVRTLRVSWKLGREDAGTSTGEGGEGGNEERALEEKRLVLFQDDLSVLIHAFTNLTTLHIAECSLHDPLTVKLQQTLASSVLLSKIVLDASFTRLGGSCDIAPTLRTLSTVQSLRVLRFEWFDSDPYTLSTPFNLRMVTTLFLCIRFDHASTLNMLESFPALVNLGFSGSNLPHSALLASITRLSPQLMSLTLEIDQWGKTTETVVPSVAHELFTPLLSLSFPSLRTLHLATARGLPRNVVELLIKADIPRLEELLLHTRGTQIGTRSVRTLVRDACFEHLTSMNVKSKWAWDDSHYRDQRVDTIAWCKRRGINLLFEAYEY